MMKTRFAVVGRTATDMSRVTKKLKLTVKINIFHFVTLDHKIFLITMTEIYKLERIVGGAESDATTSPPPSDDEGSTVATEGSTMRNSEMGGSESSGSSGGGPSSRPNPTINEIDASSPSAVPGTSAGTSSNPSNAASTEQTVVPGPGALTTGCVSNRPFRIALLKAMSAQVKTCDSALSLIPLLQVVLVILSELDGSTEEEINVVNSLIRNLLDLMKIKVR